MKLYLRRDNSRESSRFIVYDDKENLKYYVSGRRSSTTDRMIISDVEGKSLISLRVAPFSLFYVFSVRGDTGRFVITLTGLTRKPEYRFHGINWRVSEFSPDLNFSIIDIDNSLVMQQTRARKYADKGYELNIVSEHNELLCLATAICADVVNYLNFGAVAPV